VIVMAVDQDQFDPLTRKLSGCAHPAEPHTDYDNSFHVDSIPAVVSEQ
jgi:hypothetical protein